MNFARYVDARDNPGPLTVELMVQWARCGEHQPSTPLTRARRLKQLRPFARYLRQFEPRTEMPETSLFGPLPRRLAPHIYHEEEIVDLLTVARELKPIGGLRPATYETLFGLIASAGLRLSEALHLLDADVDLKLDRLTVRQTKFAKSRQLPIHTSVVGALRRYRRIRNHHLKVTADTPFFVSKTGKALGSRQVSRVFAQLRQQLGWVNRGAHHAPRIHDLRHRFAVRRMMLWHQQGTDVDQAMLALSTYMGHVKISDTYWYLTAIPELMAVAAEKFECFANAREVSDV
jgi:integrase